MAALLWLIDVGRKALSNKYVLIALLFAAAFASGYLKGASHERGKQASRQAEEVAQQQQEIDRSEVVKQELEVSHDQRVRKILSRDIPDADASRMLSTWPLKAPALGAP